MIRTLGIAHLPRRHRSLRPQPSHEATVFGRSEIRPLTPKHRARASNDAIRTSSVATTDSRVHLCRRGHGDVETLGIDQPDDDVGGVQAGPTTLTVRSARTRRDQPTAPPPPGAAPAWR